MLNIEFHSGWIETPRVTNLGIVEHFEKKSIIPNCLWNFDIVVTGFSRVGLTLLNRKGILLWRYLNIYTILLKNMKDSTNTYTVYIYIHIMMLHSLKVRPSQKESSLPIISFQVPICYLTGRVTHSIAPKQVHCVTPAKIRSHTPGDGPGSRSQNINIINKSVPFDFEWHNLTQTLCYLHIVNSEHSLLPTECLFQLPINLVSVWRCVPRSQFWRLLVGGFQKPGTHWPCYPFVFLPPGKTWMDFKRCSRTGIPNKLKRLAFFSVQYDVHIVSQTLITGLLQDSLIRLEVPFQKLYTPEELKL